MVKARLSITNSTVSRFEKIANSFSSDLFIEDSIVCNSSIKSNAIDFVAGHLVISNSSIFNIFNSDAFYLLNILQTDMVEVLDS